MAHALLAAVNPVLGIYTLIVAVPMAAIFTSSVFMNVSTTAALSVVAGNELAAIPPGSRIAALASLVVLVGLFQIAAGLLRLGFALRFVSDAVMTGFLNGVAVLIILGQLDPLTGYQSAFSNNVARALDLLLRLGRINLATTLIGGLTMALIVVLLRTLLPALSVAIIGLVQGAGVGQAYPNPDGTYPDVSGDFLGQGVGNIAASLVGGLPAGGSISGTVLIMSAGARSRWTNIFGGLCVVLVVLLAAPLAELVPMPALAALLIVAGCQGLRIQQARMIWNTSKVSAAAMVLTFLATLFMPLHYAVLLGVVFSLLLHEIGQANQIKIMQLALVPGGFPEERPVPATLPSDRFTVLHISGSLFFAAAKTLETMLPSVDGTRNAVVALILRGQPEVGSTFLNVLRRYVEALRAHDSKLMLTGVDPAVRDQLARTGMLQTIGEENVFLAAPQIGAAMNAAAAAAQEWLGQTAA